MTEVSVRTRILFLLPVLALTNCSDSTGPSGRPYFIALEDHDCAASVGPVDTVSQPGGGLVPNAGSAFIDSVITLDRPRRTVFWMLGISTVYPTAFGELTFVLLRVPNPPPVGVYPVAAVADSTVFLEGYSAPWAARSVEFDMSDDTFVQSPFVGTITVEESDATGIVGRFDLAEGRYLFDGVQRCMSASGRFSTRQR
jgi:hypothetical protein